jgi:hypothetical protein
MDDIAGLIDHRARMRRLRDRYAEHGERHRARVAQGRLHDGEFRALAIGRDRLRASPDGQGFRKPIRIDGAQHFDPGRRHSFTECGILNRISFLADAKEQKTAHLFGLFGQVLRTRVELRGGSLIALQSSSLAQPPLERGSISPSRSSHNTPPHSGHE